MIQNEIYKGNWSLPGETESYSGTLTFNPVDGAQLEIHGAFPRTHTLSSIDIVHGRTIDGWITLLNVRQAITTGSNITGASLTKYTPVYIFVGHRFSSIEEIRFRKVKFSLFNLLEWINPTVVQEDISIDHYILNYGTPSSIPIKCYEGCSGSIDCSLDRKSNFGFYEVEIKQKASITLTYDQPRSYKEIIQDTLTILRFVTLCTYEQSYPIEMNLLDDNLQEVISIGSQKQHIPKLIKLIYRSPFYSPVYKDRKFYQHLVSYDSIASNFETILPAWFKLSKELEQPLELILRSFINKYEFSIEKFMDIAKAMELFHRLRFSNKILSEQEFETRKAKFRLKDLTTKELDWIEGRMKHGNEPSLFKRLKELAKKYRFSYFDVRVKKLDKFCIQASENRNYYTHFDESLKEKALNGKELFDLMENLKIILLAGILNSISIPSEAFEQSIQGVIY
jgi:hypothetical protein